MGKDAYYPTEKPQRIAVEVQLLPGPYQPAVIERIRQSIVEPLLDMGAEITAIRIEITGQIASW
jgi:hypothetical protein